MTRRQIEWAGIAIAVLVVVLLVIGPARAASVAVTGLHVEGNRLVDNGQPVQLRGVNRSGTEYMCSGNSADSFDGPHDQASVDAIKGWAANSVRVPLNEGCWLGLNGIPQNMTAAKYQQQIADYVALLTANGMYVVVELHWSAPGSEQSTGQRQMPDMDHSPAFWTSVANTFKANPKVLFDLHNEPHDISWECWRDGGTCAGVGYQVAGMQTLLNTVRATGAQNVVMLSGNGWAGDVSRWLEFRPTDPLNNLAASWHQYNFSGCTTAACWEHDLVPVLAQVPLVVGELGEDDCGHGFVDQLMPWLDDHGASYLAWAWDTYGCGFPSLITAYDGTPSTYGAGVRSHYLALAASPTATVPPTVQPTTTTIASPTVTPMATPSATPTASPSPSATPTMTATVTVTATATASAIPTSTRTITQTPVPSATPVPTVAGTPVPGCYVAVSTDGVHFQPAKRITNRGLAALVCGRQPD